MGSVLDSDIFGEKIYERFPSKYKQDDAEQNYSLKRFIFSASEGGFKYIIDETNGLLDLLNPSVAPEKVLKLLYKNYGLEVFNGIPEEYLRNFLPYLNEACSYKGSLTSIDYISTSVTGIETHSDIVVNDEDNSVDLTITLELTSSVVKYFPDYAQFMRILEKFIPFYCNLFVVYNYMYADDEDSFHLYIGHAVKLIESLYPTNIETHDPMDYITYYENSSSDALLFEDGSVIIE